MQVILSAIIPQEGTAHICQVDLSEMKEYVQSGNFVNFVGHETVKLLGVEPAKDRRELNGYYDEAVIVKPNGRLEFGREYSISELQEIGVTCWFVRWSQEEKKWR